MANRNQARDIIKKNKLQNTKGLAFAVCYGETKSGEKFFSIYKENLLEENNAREYLNCEKCFVNRTLSEGLLGRPHPNLTDALDDFERLQLDEMIGNGKVFEDIFGESCPEGYCETLQKPLGVVPEICPDCGAVLREGANFCGQCGKRISVEALQSVDEEDWDEDDLDEEDWDEDDLDEDDWYSEDFCDMDLDESGMFIMVNIAMEWSALRENMMENPEQVRSAEEEIMGWDASGKNNEEQLERERFEREMEIALEEERLLREREEREEERRRKKKEEDDETSALLFYGIIDD